MVVYFNILVINYQNHNRILTITTKQFRPNDFTSLYFLLSIEFTN